MKKLILYFSLIAFISTVTFSSCSDSKEEDQMSITNSIKNDAAFTNAVNSTLDLVVVAQQNNWFENNEAINAIIRKGNLTPEDEQQLTVLLGMSLEDYTRHMETFGNALNSLVTQYPQLNDMDRAERQALFADAISQDPEIAAHLNMLYDNFRACFLQDLCNGLVNIAVAIGGPILCDYIAGAVPIIGPFLCNIAIQLAEDILRGICNVLPC